MHLSPLIELREPKMDKPKIYLHPSSGNIMGDYTEKVRAVESDPWPGRVDL